jgi:succinylglutamate desuccinylase
MQNNSKNNQKKVLFVCCTHGDEHVGRFIFDNYPQGKNEYFEWKSIIANPEAMYLNQRYVDTDLNRSFPGNQQSKKYEERRAAILTDIIKQYDVVIDIHGALCPQEDSIIVTKYNEDIAEQISYLDLKHVIHNNSIPGLLVNQAKIGITLEYGFPERHLDGYRRVEKTILGFLKKEKSKQKKKHYEYFGELSTTIIEKTGFSLTNFKPLTEKEKTLLGITNQTSIYPYFVGDESIQGIYCDLLVEKNLKECV